MITVAKSKRAAHVDAAKFSPIIEARRRVLLAVDERTVRGFCAIFLSRAEKGCDLLDCAHAAAWRLWARKREGLERPPSVKLQAAANVLADPSTSRTIATALRAMMDAGLTKVHPELFAYLEAAAVGDASRLTALVQPIVPSAVA